MPDDYTTIRVTTDTHEELSNFGKKSDSWDDIMKKIIFLAKLGQKTQGKPERKQ